MLGEEHAQAFVVTDPTGIVIAAVGQVGRQQRIETVIGELALQWFEPNFLQHHVAVGIGEYFLVDSVAAAVVSVDQLKSGNAGLERFVLKPTVPFLLGKESLAIGDDEAEIASASLVDPGKIYFI